jgi:hypothetical protein
MMATDLYRQSFLRRRTVECVAGFVVALALVIGVVGFLAAQARGFGCAARSIAQVSSQCSGLAPANAPASSGAVHIVFETDSSAAQR